LFGIFKSENPKWANEVIRQRKEKLNRIKTDWVADMKLNKGQLTEEDYSSVISKEKPEEQSQYGGASSFTMGSRKQKGQKE